MTTPPPGRRALVTGSAGFIGYHVAARLLEAGWRVVGLDSLDPYYDPGLKRPATRCWRTIPGFAR